MFIANGANVSLRNILCQSNKQGGVKIHYKQTDKQYYLQGLNFDNLYTENNGLLNESDEQYEGNWAVYIDSEYQNQDGFKCAQNITLNGCGIHKSQNGKTLKIDGGRNIFFENMLFDGNSIIDIADSYRVSSVQYDCPSSEVYANIVPSQSNIVKKSINNYGVKYNRLYTDEGRCDNYKFYLADIASWGTQYATSTTINSTSVLGEPILTKTNIVRITAYKLVRQGATGKINISLVSEKIGAEGNGEVITDVDGNKCTYEWNFDTQGTFFDKHIQPGKIIIQPGYSINFLIESKGHANGDNTEYIFNLICAY